MNQQHRAPYTEIETRQAAGWKSFFVENPDSLPEALASETAAAASVTIRQWSDIPDVASFPDSQVAWVAEGLIPTGAITLLGGDPGSYKTWLALTLAVAVSKGGSFLGRGCRQRDVLILDRENPLSVVQERFDLLGIGPATGLKIWGGWCQDQPPLIGDFRLREIAQERRPLIIFDSLLRFHGAEENSASEMRQVMGELRGLANAGATPFVLHHKPKAEGTHYRGSSDILGGVDVAYSVLRNREAESLRLECFKSRYGEEISLTIRPELSDRGEFTVTDAPEVSEERLDVAKLRATIEAEPGIAQEELVKRSTIAKGRARQILHRGIGTSWRVEPGGRNAKQFFPLAPQANEVELEI